MSTSFDLSSNCYVKYCITAKRKKGGRESFYKLREMLEDLIDKYGVTSAYESTRGEDALDLDEHNKICIYLWTPGLSDNFLEVANEKELEKREAIFSYFGSNNYPPDVLTAISSLFSERGNDFGYLNSLGGCRLLEEGCELEAEEFGKGISTNLTLKEAKRLAELLGEVNIKETEGIYPSN